MKRIMIILSLLALLVCIQPVYAETPLIVEKVVSNKEFFAGFTRYRDCYLYDVSRIGMQRVGLILLTPLGFEHRLVLDNSGVEIYKDSFVPEKNKREAMKSESIRVTDAVKVAKAVIAHERKEDAK